MYLYVYVCVYVVMDVCMYVCMLCVCMHVCVYKVERACGAQRADTTRRGTDVMRHGDVMARWGYVLVFEMCSLNKFSYEQKGTLSAIARCGVAPLCSTSAVARAPRDRACTRVLQLPA